MSKETGREAEVIINRILSRHAVALFTLSHCKICQNLKLFLQGESINFYSVDIDEHNKYTILMNELTVRTQQRSAPFVFIRKSFVGNHTKIFALYHSGALVDMIEGKSSSRYDFDIIVVGGGFGGLAVAKEASESGKKVGLFDFVMPSNKGSVWHGLGGTCGNVGCVPRKLVNYGAKIYEFYEDGKYFGWNFEFKKEEQHDWNVMMNNIKKYVKKLNIDFQKQCSASNVRVFNAKVTRFIDHHTIEAEDKEQRKARFTAQVFVIAIGGRPKCLNFPGVNYITTDDLFTLPQKPRKALVIGASFVAFESAGFLNDLGVDCTMLVRSQPLKYCDSEIADMVISHMKSIGIRFIKVRDDFELTERKPSKRADSKSEDDSNKHFLKYELKLKSEGSLTRLKSSTDLCFDTIIMAVGRTYDVTGLGLQHLGVKLNERNGKIRVNKYQRTDCHTIFAVGDITDGYMELAPIAVKCGKFLARRMNGSEEMPDMKYIPMALYTPLQCAFCGYREDNAVAEFGEKNVITFQNRFYPMQWAIQQRNYNRCYVKLVCLKNLNNKVIGLHMIGPNSAEISQGFAFAMRQNMTKTDLDSFLGIYPTCAEVMFKMDYDAKFKDKALKPTGSVCSMLV